MSRNNFDFRQQLMPAADEIGACPLCHLAAIIRKPSQHEVHVQCSNCTNFVVADTVMVMLPMLSSRMLVALSYAAWTANGAGTPVTVTVQNLAQLVAPFI